MRVALLIEYEGTEFSGWQIQPGVRTVQDEIETALKQIVGQPLRIMGAGRTDTGVHASGMVAHLDLDESVDLKRLILGLNGTTGSDIAIKEIRPVPSGFNARFAATSRSYEYTLTTNFRALYRRHVWHVWRPLDPAVMAECATLLMGEHDFTSFSKASEDFAHLRCTIKQSEWSCDGHQMRLSITANRFVRGMVRALTGAMVQVGQGRMELQHFSHLLDEPNEAERAKYMAPPQGLVLTRVSYPEDLGLW